MPVACLCGHGPQALIGMSGQVPAISPKWIRQIGIRSVDEGEKRFVHEQDLEVFDMRYIDEMGMRAAMELALALVDANTHLHVSFDVDFLDPDIAPGVGTTVRGGPNYREAQVHGNDRRHRPSGLAGRDGTQPGTGRAQPHGAGGG
jgi:arginase